MDGGRSFITAELRPLNVLSDYVLVQDSVWSADVDVSVVFTLEIYVQNDGELG